MDTEPKAGTRVTLFMHDFSRTGVVVNAVRLANALAARGHPTCILACSDAGGMAQQLDAAVQVRVVRHPVARLKLPRGLALLASIPALRRALRQLQPQVLLSAGNHGHLPIMVASAGLPGMRRVLRISNDLDHPGDGAVMRQLRRFVHRQLVHRADRLLLVSGHLAAHPVLAEAQDAGKVMLVPNGVPIEKIRQQATGRCDHPWIGGAEPVIVAVGRLVRQKNLRTLVQAFARASRERPMKLVIIGAGSEAEQRRLGAQATALGVQDRLRFEGELADPFALLARCNVFVLPSLWEGASNALLEALACNVPVVASRSAGSAQQVLGYGRYGLLVDPLDVAGMAQAILYQSGADACRPGSRATDFAMGNMLARACAAILAEEPAPVGEGQLVGERQ